MAPKAPKADALLKRNVRINDDAATLKGVPLPQAGQMGKIIGRTPGGKQYQVEVGDSILNLTMDSFEVVQGDGEGSESAPAAVTGPMIKLSHIVPSKTNRKAFDPEALQLLAASIKTYGVLQPLLVRRLPASRLQETYEDPDTRHATHEIIAGERRWRAAGMAGLVAVPCFETSAVGSVPVVMQLLENIQREDLKPLDEARGIEALVHEHGYTRPQVAEALGRSLTHVFESQRLLQLCPEAIAAMHAGTLTRSVALVVAQRPTAALQAEFCKRVLTTGPDGGPLSYRSAKDLAARHYQTDLVNAPFKLDDADLHPKAGACAHCPKRTGAAPELFDKNSADVCTDVACFGAKKEAHYDAMKAKAQQAGRKVITGKEARELMPTDGVAPTGYMLLDKPAKGEKAPLRSLLGSEVPAEKVVLIESPSGAMVEAIPTRTAGAALEAKGKTPASKPAEKKPSEPSREELEAKYQERWREAALHAVCEGVRAMDATQPFALPATVAYRLLLTIAHETDDAALQTIFPELPADFDEEELRQHVREVAEAGEHAQRQAMLMLTAAFDAAPLFGRPADEAIQLHAAAEVAGVDIQAVRLAVQDEMRAEMKAAAAERAAAATPKPADKAKPTLKARADKPPKTTKAEATAAIAQAMAAASSTSTGNDFAPNDKVRIKIDLKGPGKNAKLLPTKGRTATIDSKCGDRTWMVSLPQDPSAADADMVERWALIADYTELEAI